MIIFFNHISFVLLNFLVTVRAAPHECLTRTGLSIGKAENDVRFYSKVSVSPCAITSV